MSFFQDVINIAVKYYPQLLSGVGNTMLIALTGTAAGLIIGLLTGVIRTAPKSKNAVLRALHKIVNAIIAVYIEVFRGTPMMVQAMVIYWGYAFLNDGATLPLIPAGLFIVSINTGAYMAEIVRGGCETKANAASTTHSAGSTPRSTGLCRSEREEAAVFFIIASFPERLARSAET